jgi:tetratricopeptide (TPR) repeat protein
MLEDFQRALEDLDKVDVLEPNNAFILQSHGHVKKMLDNCQGALEDMDKANVLELNNAFTLKWHGDVKRISKDLDNVDVFEPNNVFTLILHAYTNWNLNNYQIALETIEKVHGLTCNG